MLNWAAMQRWSAVAPVAAAPAAGASPVRLASAALLCMALLAMSSHSLGRDSLLQTAYAAPPQPALQAPAGPGVQITPQMMQMMINQYNLQRQQLQEEGAAPPGEPAATMPPPGEPAATMPAVTMPPPVKPAAAMSPPAEPAATMPQAAVPQAAAPLPLQPPKPPPPPPIAGSEPWLLENEPLVAPGPEKAIAGANLAMSQVGPLAVNMDQYYQNKARIEAVRAKVQHALLKDLEKAQPCEIEIGEDGVTRCKAGTGKAIEGWLPNSVLGMEMPWASAPSDDGKDHAVTSEQVYLLCYDCLCLARALVVSCVCNHTGLQIAHFILVLAQAQSMASGLAKVETTGQQGLDSDEIQALTTIKTEESAFHNPFW